jgi:hypothetical protein
MFGLRSASRPCLHQGMQNQEPHYHQPRSSRQCGNRLLTSLAARALASAAQPAPATPAAIAP